MLKKLISTMLILTLLLTFTTSSFAGSRFKDVPDNSWYGKAVNTLYDKKMLFGVGDKKFNPNGTVTRIEYITILTRLALGEDPEGLDSDKSWMDKYIRYANELGLSNEKDLNYWKKIITREEVAYFTNQFFKISSDEELTPYGNITVFEDTKDSKYSKDINAIAGTVMIGFIHKDNKFYFHPKDNLRRSEIAVVMYRLYNLMYDEETYDKELKINDYRFQLYAMAKAMYINRLDDKGTIDLSNDTDNIQEEIESISNFATKKEDPILTLEQINKDLIKCLENDEEIMDIYDKNKNNKIEANEINLKKLADENFDKEFIEQLQDNNISKYVVFTTGDIKGTVVYNGEKVFIDSFFDKYFNADLTLQIKEEDIPKDIKRLTKKESIAFIEEFFDFLLTEEYISNKAMLKQVKSISNWIIDNIEYISN